MNGSGNGLLGACSSSNLLVLVLFVILCSVVTKFANASQFILDRGYM